MSVALSADVALRLACRADEPRRGRRTDNLTGGGRRRGASVAGMFDDDRKRDRLLVRTIRGRSDEPAVGRAPDTRPIRSCLRSPRDDCAGCVRYRRSPRPA